MKKLILLLFLVSVFLVAFLPVKDTDFGWHYRCGNQFLTTGRLCLKNEFSYFLSDYQAYNPSFIYDIILAFVYNHFGFVGVSLLGSIILTFSAFFFFQLLKGPFWFRIISFYLMFFLSYSVFALGTRTQIVSFLFFVVTLKILEQARRKQELFFRSKVKQGTSNNRQKNYSIESNQIKSLVINHSFPFSAKNNERTELKKNPANPNNNITHFTLSTPIKAGKIIEANETSAMLLKRLDRARNFERVNFIIKNDFNSFIYHLSILLPLFILWVNTHIGFFLGPILLAIFLISQTIINFNKKSTIFNFSFLIFNFFITFLNPFGPKVYLEIFRHAQAPLNTMIAEWVAPPFWQKILIIFFSVQVVILLTINKWRNGWREPGISAINLFANKTTTLLINKKTAGRNGRDPIKAQLDDNSDQLNQNLYFQAAKNEINDIENIRTSIDGREISARNRFFYIFLLFLFAFLALTGRRNLPYFYTILFYILSQFFKIKKGETFHWEISTRYFSHLIIPILVSFIFFLSVTQLPQTLTFAQSWKNYCQNGLLPLPCQAIEKTNLKNLSGNLYTAYEWGGFLIWQAPKLKVFVDGRMSAWKSKKEHYAGSGHYPYQVYLYIIQARQGWDKILKKYQTNYLLIGNGTFLDLELQKNGEKYGFKEKYRDRIAVFYTYTNTN